ncbi:hypothetical protein TrRE_jg12398 [Triparma retinervis]|uniref:Uncharacterized protein n=1 Tax=Triparma retinervis TaxID=2557542 RepID=A0A9W7DUA8_9STRA|nr:hypothetical protein TrRE_jg12398 [Triparma retinervis]
MDLACLLIASLLVLLSSQETRPVQSNIQILDLCKKFTSQMHKLYSPALTKRTIVLQVVFFCLSFSSFGLMSLITPLFEKIGIDSAYMSTVVFNSAGMLGNILSFVTIDRYNIHDCIVELSGHDWLRAVPIMANQNFRFRDLLGHR